MKNSGLYLITVLDRNQIAYSSGRWTAYMCGFGKCWTLFDVKVWTPIASMLGYVS